MLKDQLRKARKAAGKTQKDVASFLGVTESTYCGYETGKREPDALKIRRIASFLGVTGDYLLETGINTPPVVLERKKLVFCETEDEECLVLCYRSLDDKAKSAALSSIKGMAGNPDLKEERSNITTA